MLLNNVEQNLQSGLKWCRNHDFTVRGNSFLSRNIESLSRDYAEYSMLLAHNVVQFHRDYMRAPRTFTNNRISNVALYIKVLATVKFFHP